MKELWIKKTIWRRYLVEDGDLEEAQQTLDLDERGDEIVADWLDKNEKVEYDNEEAVKPIEYSISNLVDQSEKPD